MEAKIEDEKEGTQIWIPEEEVIDKTDVGHVN